MSKQKEINPKKYGKVAVLMGGWSAEREISLNSGQAVLGALQQKGVDAHGIDVQRDIVRVLSDSDFDRAFVMLHGRGGEDGVIQGVLETLEIPYTGSGIMASSVCMDKLRTKQMWMGAGLRTPPLYITRKAEPSLGSVAKMGFPVMVKPIHEGSSIGMSKVHSSEDIAAAWEKARQYDNLVMAEKYIEGREYTVAILGSEALPMILLQTPHDFYDFNAKYEANDTEYYCPCGLDEKREKELQTLALMAFGAVGASGWGRVDMILDEEDVPWLIEINTAPGMTDHSLVPMAAAAAGISFEDLVIKVLESSLSPDKDGDDEE